MFNFIRYAFCITLINCLLCLHGQEFLLNIGDTAPPFEGTNQYGHIIRSGSLVKVGKILLVFYRGNWCPYCTDHLARLQDSLRMIQEKKVNVVVVTPENPPSIKKTIKKSDIEYSILWDKNYKIINDFGVGFKVSKETIPDDHSSVLSNTRKANDNEDDILPVPATFIIDENHIISALHYDPNYKVRMSVSRILEHLCTMDAGTTVE